MRRVEATPLRAFFVGALYYDRRTGLIRPRPRLNQSELARRAGVSRRTLSRVANEGAKTLDLWTADRIVTAMGMHLENLWGPGAGL